MKNPETLNPQPEPILIGFLQRVQLLDVTKIIDDKIQAIGIDRKSKDEKVTGRSITAEELDAIEEWTDNHPEIKDDPLFNWNTKALEQLRHRLYQRSLKLKPND